MLQDRGDPPSLICPSSVGEFLRRLNSSIGSAKQGIHTYGLRSGVDGRQPFSSQEHCNPLFDADGFEETGVRFPIPGHMVQCRVE